MSVLQRATSRASAHLGILLLLALVVLFEVHYYWYFSDPRSPYLADIDIISEANIIRLFFISATSYLLVFPEVNRHLHFKFVITSMVIGLTVGTLLLFAANPVFADDIARENELVENFSALFLFIGCLLALFAAMRLAFARRFLLSGLLLFVAIGLLVIGMEEISWTQRIIGIESTGIFLESNLQRETNLHNFNTFLSETIYYVGAFMVLTLLPFYKDSLLAFFKKHRFLHQLTPLLPGAWLLVPFAMIAGFIKSGDYYTSAFIILVLTVTVAFLAHRFAEYFKAKNYVSLLPIGVSLVITIASAAIFALMDYDGLSVRNWPATEYRELFIGIGLFAYVVDVYFRLFSSTPRKQEKSA